MKTFWNSCKQILALTLTLVIVMVTPAQAAPQVPNTSEKDLLEIYREREQYQSRLVRDYDDSKTPPWIDMDNGDTIEEVIQSITDSPFEIHVAFNKNGKKMMDGTNQMSDLVNWAPGYQHHSGDTTIHVHPARDSSFSAGDLAIGALYDEAEVIVVAWDFIFSMKPGKNGWPDSKELEKYHQEQLNKAERMPKLAFEPKWAEAMTALKHNGLPWTTSQTGEAFLYTHYAAIKTAEHFGLEYEALPRRETDEIKPYKGCPLKQVVYTNPIKVRKRNNIYYEYSAE